MSKLYRAYLSINGIEMPVKRDDYSVSYTDVVSNDGGTTEAGTMIRDVIREGVPSVAVNFTVTEQLLAVLRSYKRLPSLDVVFYDAGVLKSWAMYIDNFRFSLAADDGSAAAYDVSMTLEDIAGV